MVSLIKIMVGTKQLSAPPSELLQDQTIYKYCNDDLSVNKLY